MDRKVGYVGILGIAFFIAAGYHSSVRWVTGQSDRSATVGRVSVLDFGAVGDGRTDDTAAIQAAIDAGNEIHFPDVPAFYHIRGSLLIGGTDQSGGKRLIGHRPCRGGGGFPGKPALIQGDGSATLLSAVGTTKQNRAIELVGLSAMNTGRPILDFMSGIDGMVDNCSFRTLKNTDATIRLRESYNVTIRESSIVCSGGGFAITAYQQCNKLRIQNCRLGGGDAGGAAHVEQSLNVQIEGNVVELGLYGLVISSGVRLDQPKAGNVEGAGACHALRISSNYFENIQHPMVIASAMGLEKLPGQAVFGAVIESNNIGNYSFDFPLITVGRLQAASIRCNSLWRKADGKADAIHATFARGAIPAYMSDCLIEANTVMNGSGAYVGSDEVNVGAVPLIQQLKKENRISHP